MIVDRFRLLEAKHNVDIRPGKISNSVALTRSPGHAILSFSGALALPERMVGIAMMLGVLEKKWPGSRYLYRFPSDLDSLALARSLSGARQDYRPVFRWAADFLITDGMLKDFERQGYEAWQVLEEIAVTKELLAFRLGVLPGALQVC